MTDPVLRHEGEVLERDHMLQVREVECYHATSYSEQEHPFQAEIKEETLSESVAPTHVPSYCQAQEFDYYNSEFLQNGTLKSR